MVYSLVLMSKAVHPLTLLIMFIEQLQDLFEMSYFAEKI